MLRLLPVDADVHHAPVHPPFEDVTVHVTIQCCALLCTVLHSTVLASACTSQCLLPVDADMHHAPVRPPFEDVPLLDRVDPPYALPQIVDETPAASKAGIGARGPMKPLHNNTGGSGRMAQWNPCSHNKAGDRKNGPGTGLNQKHN